MDNSEKPPLLISPHAVGLDQIAALMRTIALVLSVVTALAGLVSRRDLAGFIAYVQSSDFITAASVVSGMVALAWGQWKVRHRARQVVTVAADPRVPDDVAKVKAP